MEAMGTPLVRNERFAVTRWEFHPGASTAMHTHEHDYVVVPVTGGHFEVAMPDGDVMEVTQVAAERYALEAGARHDVCFVGEGVAVFLEIEAMDSE